jgi:hypothetical protein
VALQNRALHFVATAVAAAGAIRIQCGGKIDCCLCCCTACYDQMGKADECVRTMVLDFVVGPIPLLGHAWDRNASRHATRSVCWEFVPCFATVAYCCCCSFEGTTILYQAFCRCQGYLSFRHCCWRPNPIVPKTCCDGVDRENRQRCPPTKWSSWIDGAFAHQCADCILLHAPTQNCVNYAWICRRHPMKIYQVCGRFQHHCLREAPIDECRFASLSKSMTFRPFHRIESSSDRSKVLRANDEPMYRADNTLEQERV